MEVTPEMYAWLSSQNVINPFKSFQSDINTSTSFQIPNQTLELLIGGKYIDNILRSLQESYNKLYDLKLDYTDNLKDVKQISEDEQYISNSIKYTNWHIYQESLNHFGLKYPDEIITSIINGDKEILLQVLTDIFELQNEVVKHTHTGNKNFDPNKFIDEGNLTFKNTVTESKNKLKINETSNNITEEKSKFNKTNSSNILTQETFQNKIKGQSESININKLDPEKKYDHCNSPLEFFIISLCKNLKLKPRQSVALLSNNRKYLSILCNKGTQGNYDQIKKWLYDLDLNLKILTRLLKSYSDGISICYAIIGTALCSKDYEVVKTCSELLNKILNDVGINWDWLIKEGFDSFIYAIIKHEKLRVDLLTLLFQFIKGKNKDFFAVLRKKFSSGEKKKIYEFFSSILPDIKNLNNVFLKQLQDFLFEICLNENEDMSISLTVLGDAFFYFFPFEEDLIKQILDYFNNCISNNSENIFSTAVSQIFNLMERFGEIKNEYGPPLYKNIVYSLISNYDNENKREFILLSFEKFLNNHQTVPIDILLEPYLRNISASKNFAVCDFVFLFKIIEHPRINGSLLKAILRFILRVSLENMYYARTANLILGLIFERKIIMRQCNNNEVSEISKLFSEYIKTALNLFITNLKKIEDTAILETPYDILNENFPNVNNMTHNNVIQAVQLYRKEKGKNSQGLLSLLWCFDDHDEVLFNLEETNRPIYEPIEIFIKKQHEKQEKEDSKNFMKKNQKLLSKITDKRKEKETTEKHKTIEAENKEKEIKKHLDLRRKRNSIMIGITPNQLIDNNLLTGENNSNLAMAISKATENYKNKNIALTESDSNKNMIRKYQKMLSKDKEALSMKDIKMYEKLIATGQLIYPEGTIIKDRRIARSKSSIFRIDHGKFPLPINLENEEEREKIAIQGYNVQYKENLKFYFRTYSNEKTDTISKSSLIRMYRDRGYKKNQISLEELNLTIRNLFNDNINDLTFDQFKEIIVQLSYLIYEKSKYSLSISECYEKFLNRLCLTVESDELKNIYRKYRPAILLMNEKRELKEKFNYPPGFKLIKKERVIFNKMLPENLINLIGEDKYICYSVLNEIFYNVFNSSLIEPYVTIENSKKIEIDPLEVLKHKWTVDLTMAYINLDKEYKVYGEICADILEQGLRKVCYRKDEKGNLILRPLEIKENEINNQLLKEKMKKDEDRIKRKNEIEEIVKEYEKIKKKKKKDEREKLKKKREKELEKQRNIEKQFEEKVIKNREEEEKMKKKKKKEERKKKRKEEKDKKEAYDNEIQKITERGEKLKNRIEKYHQKKLKEESEKKKIESEEKKKEREEIQKKYSELITKNGGEEKGGFVDKAFEKDLNKKINELMEKEDIKMVLDKYSEHLHYVYDKYVTFGNTKLNGHMGMGKNEFKEFLINFTILGLLVSVNQMNWIFIKVSSEKIDERQGQSFFDYNDFITSIGYLSIFARFTQRSRQLIQNDLDETNGSTIENFMKFLGFEEKFNKKAIEETINDRRSMSVKKLLGVQKENKYKEVTQDLVTNKVVGYTDQENEEDKKDNEEEGEEQNN